MSDQPRWLTFAWADFGIAEAPGTRNNPKVVRYYAEVGHAAVTDDEVAWCAAFLGACLERAGIRSTRSLMARSYLGWGEPLEEARPGAVAVLSRGFDPRLGHVGFLVGETDGEVILLGGNQGDAVSVQAFPRSRVLGLRWPASVPVAAPVLVPEPAQAPEAEPELVGDFFERALAHVLAMEGGYSEDPYDPGGPTNFGITIGDFAREQGAELTGANLPALKSELKKIAPATVRRIYRDRYWLPASCPELPPPLAFFHFDAAVNQGVRGAARMLQQAVGTTVDGRIGPRTLAAVAARPVEQILERYAGVRRNRYRALPTFWRFGKGWLGRVERTLELADQIERTFTSFSPSRAKEYPPMTTDTEPIATPAEGPKWWGQSLTIWGVVITTLSTVLPTLGPLFGLNITGELIRQLGDQLVLVGQAVGGLVGTILTIYGRARATAPLERRQITMNM